MIGQMSLSACGIYDCLDCRYLTNGSCPGCVEGNGRLGEGDEKPCAVFGCVKSLGIASCRECGEISCVLRRSIESICPLRSRFENTRWWAGRMARALESRKHICRQADGKPRMSDRVVNRLRLYLTALDWLAEQGETSVPSWRLAQKVGVNAALIRKDLSRFGEFGTPSFGYRIDYLSQRIGSILGLDEPRGVVWIGAACMRLHLQSIGRLAKHQCRVVAVFDASAEEVGRQVGGLEVLPLEKLPEFLAGSRVSTAVLALAGPAAAKAAAMLAEQQIEAVVNLSGEMLALPEGVKVCTFDVVGELLELCHYCR
jgi:redox-sensing transcriptional repressor